MSEAEEQPVDMLNIMLELGGDSQDPSQLAAEPASRRDSARAGSSTDDAHVVAATSTNADSKLEAEVCEVDNSAQCPLCKSHYEDCRCMHTMKHQVAEAVEAEASLATCVPETRLAAALPDGQELADVSVEVASGEVDATLDIMLELGAMGDDDEHSKPVDLTAAESPPLTASAEAAEAATFPAAATQAAKLEKTQRHAADDHEPTCTPKGDALMAPAASPVKSDESDASNVALAKAFLGVNDESKRVAIPAAASRVTPCARKASPPVPPQSIAKARASCPGRLESSDITKPKMTRGENFTDSQSDSQSDQLHLSSAHPAMRRRVMPNTLSGTPPAAPSANTGLPSVPAGGLGQKMRNVMRAGTKMSGPDVSGLVQRESLIRSAGEVSASSGPAAVPIETMNEHATQEVVLFLMSAVYRRGDVAKLGEIPGLLSSHAGVEMHLLGSALNKYVGIFSSQPCTPDQCAVLRELLVDLRKHHKIPVETLPSSVWSAVFPLSVFFNEVGLVLEHYRKLLHGRSVKAEKSVTLKRQHVESDPAESRKYSRLFYDDVPPSLLRRDPAFRETKAETSFSEILHWLEKFERQVD